MNKFHLLLLLIGLIYNSAASQDSTILRMEKLAASVPGNFFTYCNLTKSGCLIANEAIDGSYFRSFDGGNNWERKELEYNNGTFKVLEDGILYFFDAEHLSYSDNCGETWTSHSICSPFNLTRAFLDSDRNIWAFDYAVNLYIYSSADSIWKPYPVFEGKHVVDVVSDFNHSVLHLLVYENDTLFYQKRDLVSHTLFQQMITTADTNTLKYSKLNVLDDVYIIENQNFSSGGFFRSVDNGINWTADKIITNSSASFDFLGVLGDKIIGAIPNLYWDYFQSTNNGITWSPLNLSEDIRQFYILSDGSSLVDFGCDLVRYHNDSNPLQVDTMSGYGLPSGFDDFVISSDSAYYALKFNQLLKSMDNGISWHEVFRLPKRSYTDLFIGNNGAIVLHSNVGIFKSIDFGDSFFQINFNNLFNYTGSGIRYLETLDNLQIVSNGILTFRSVDNGASWENVVGLIPEPVEDFTSNLKRATDGTLYFANRGELLMSIDNGSIWQIIYSSINHFSIEVGNNNDLYCIRYDGILMKTVDKGLNWSMQSLGVGFGDAFRIKYLSKIGTLIVKGTYLEGFYQRYFIHYSENNGDTFTKLGNEFNRRMEVSDSGVLFSYYTSLGTHQIYKSMNSFSFPDRRPQIFISLNDRFAPRPIYAYFQAKYLNNPTLVQWSYGNSVIHNGNIGSTQYSTIGSYTVRVIAENIYGADTLTLPDFVNIVPYHGMQLTSDFVADVTEGYAPLEVNFINLSVPCANATWNFGDSIFVWNFTPKHTYNVPGIYDVTLVSHNLLEEQTVRKMGYIRVLDSCQTVYNDLDTVNICEGQEYVVCGQIYSQAGNYSQICQASSGCDSIISFILNVANTSTPPFTSAITNLCNSDTIVGCGGQIHTTQGVYIDTCFNQPQVCGAWPIQELTVVDQPIHILINGILDPSSQSSTDGVIQATVNGGLGMLVLEWVGPNQAIIGNTPVITGLGNGVYTLSAHDQAGCVAYSQPIELFASVNTYEINKAPFIHVVPNPARQSVRFISAEIGTTSNLKLFTIDGKELANNTSYIFGSEIDLSGFPMGLLMVKVQLEAGATKMFLLVHVD